MPSTRAVRPILVAAVALLVASTTPLAWTGFVAYPGVAATAATTTDYLNLRDGPSLGNTVLLVMPVGASVTVTGNPQAGFYPVSHGGIQGWAAGDYLDLADASGGGGGTAITTDDLNLRTGPSLDAAILLVMPWSAAVTLTGSESGQFVAISYNGSQGWAARDYLQFSGGSTGGSGGGASGGTATVLEDLNLRAEPSLSAGVRTVMPAGAAVGLTGDRAAGFAEVVYNGLRGWAFATFLDDGDDGRGPRAAPSNPLGLAPPAPGSGTAIVTDNLNLRSAASTSAAVRTVMPAGAAVTLTGAAQNGYYLVLYQGERGWASATYLLGGGRPQDQYGYTQALIESFIVQAARRYGQDPDAMLRVAHCESNLVATAVNPAGSYGIFQFVRSTWESTPYADNDVFEAWANANAAAWMWSVGRRHEWVCQ